MRAARGSDVKARRQRIGMKVYELAEQAKIHPDTLSDWERGKRHPQPDTIKAVLDVLDRLEEEMGLDALPPAEDDREQRKPGLVRFEVTGVYGADALVVEGPIENIAELQAAVDRIMRGSSRRADETQD